MPVNTTSTKPCIMLKSFSFEVKGKHIRDGVPNDSERCPISLALRENLRPDCFAIVAHDYIQLENGVIIRIPTTASQKEFIEKFDNRKSSVKPQAFLMLMPQEFLK